MSREAGRSIALAAVLALAAAGRLGADAGKAAAGAGTWTIALARLQVSGKPEGDAAAVAAGLADRLPRLVCARLASLPARRTPAEEAAESAGIEGLKARFAAGADYATKLDARAASFLDPALDPNAKAFALSQAEKALASAAKKLEDLGAEAGKAAGTAPAGGGSGGDALTARLWEGYAKGLLVDPPGSGAVKLARAAKGAGADLLVHGSISVVSGYAKVALSGFDSALGRDVFAWKSFCATDDPEPLAAELGLRLSRWAAGRDYASLAVAAEPASAEIRVDGSLLSGEPRIAYAYAGGTVVVEASAPGYAPRRADVALALGDRKSIQLKLEPLATGTAELSTTPTGASISLDSEPLGVSPISIPLNGSRGIVSVSAAGRESASVVLPASGNPGVVVELAPDDGIGVNGRISAAKDRFFRSLGWLMLAVPATSLSAGIFLEYNDAYNNSFDTGLLAARNVSGGALGAVVAATCTAAVFAAIRLADYLRIAR